MPKIIRRFSSTTIIIITLALLTACGGSASVSGPAAGVQNDVVQAQSPAPSEPASSEPELSVDEVVDAPVLAPVETPPIPDQTSVPEDIDLSPPSDQSPQVAADSDLPAQTPAAPRTYTVADITDLVLVTGQSNALGADTSYDFNQDSPHERVFAFTEEGWIKADLHQVWDLGWFPRGNPGADPSNNLALHFGKEVVRRQSHRVVGIVLATAPGMGIDHWDADGDFFSQIDQKVIDAVNQTPHKNGIDGILWHQGESDAGNHDYHSKLDSLIDRFRQRSWYSIDRPFICGETAAFEVVNQQLRGLNSNGDRWSGCVGSDGLQTREDGFHFNAEGLRELGRRYADRYLEVIR